MFEYKNIDVIKSANQFEIEGDIKSVERFGSGHINDTYCVTTNRPGGKRYLLQRVNSNIFQNVAGLMDNTNLVIDHLKRKLISLGQEPDVEKKTLTLIPTRTGELFFQDQESDCWRMFILIEDTKSYDIVGTPAQAFSGGQAFGDFQRSLSDLDATRLVEILPNFHNIDFRMSNLAAAIAEDAAGRAVEVQDVLTYIFDRKDRMRTVLKMGNEGKLPLRITHNDTKFNNVLLDMNDNVQCVIDLDTVMPGYVAYDFGDAIRTIINSAAEDEEDLSKVILNIPLYEAYSRGYLSEAKDFLTADERDSLLHGVFLLPYMQAVRFLTDYLNGDTYYKIQYPTHNLVRTNAQLKLVHELESNEQMLANILNASMSI
ncbi:MAG: phosphotransferase enzyme family protein [Sphingobacterium sp.]|uniref:phosphotransferase enzyme family protein n=1 Tax=Sphingobacterium sp. JB170 TaxID=1434842 RepID=UPI00097E9F4E|nr:aminoglycoside phosphotransferase family protein [Sphingobacterium sp. JB170]SJN38668.1 N-acetylhexosamine 1-kinase [Sphingobacterium sp. JB170]